MPLSDSQMDTIEQLRQVGKGKKLVDTPPGAVEFEDGHEGDNRPLTPEEVAPLQELQAWFTPERLDALVKQYPIPPEFWTDKHDCGSR